MPRTPKPDSTKLQTVRLERHNYDFLEKEAERSGYPIGYALNQSLEFARTGGLPRRLREIWNEKLEEERSSLREAFKSIIWEAAMGLPRTAWPPKQGVPPLDRTYHVTSVNLSGYNRAYVTSLTSDASSEFTGALNSELEFARTFGLRPELEARLAQRLKHTGESFREWVMLELLRHALPFRDSIPADETPTARPYPPPQLKDK